MRTGLFFAALIERATGIVMPERDFLRLEKLAAERAAYHGLSNVRSYLKMLRRDRDSEEWRFILGQITVKESSLFRGEAQFEVLREEIIPEWIRSGREKLKIWSAGCARGEEPATIAVIMSEIGVPPPGTIQIIATDVDREALRRAEKAIFSPRAVRRVPQDILSTYFVRNQNGFQLRRPYRSIIEFRYFNLVDIPYPPQWKEFDVVFLRNVLIYFRQQQQGEVIRAVVDSMRHGAYLFAGPSESLWNLHSGLRRQGKEGCFVYRKTSSLPSTEEDNVSRKLPDISFRVREGLIRHPSTGRSRDLSQAPDPKTCPLDRNHLIKEIVSELSRGRIDRSEALLAGERRNPTNPLWRALEGITFRLQGRKEEALRSFRAALYLDESLYQLRYLMAKTLDELGWEDRARAEYLSVLRSLKMGGGKELPELTALGVPGRVSLEKLCRDALDSRLTEPRNQPG